MIIEAMSNTIAAQAIEIDRLKEQNRVLAKRASDIHGLYQEQVYTIRGLMTPGEQAKLQRELFELRNEVKQLREF